METPWTSGTYFVEIVRRGGFTRAADAIRVAQPALSSAIRNLEAELGVRLLNRGGRQVTLTPDGRAFLAHAEEILSRVRGLELEMQERQGLVRGELVVALPAMLATYAFPGVLSAFRVRHPRLRLAVETGGARTIEHRIAAGAVDVGIVARDGVREDLVYRRLLRDEVVACVARGHPLAGRRSLSVEQLAKEPLLLFGPGFFQRDLVLAAIEARGLKAQIALESDLVPLLLDAASRGGGITTVLRMAAESEPRVIPLSLRPAVFIEAGIAWKAGAYLSRAARAFVEFVLEAELPGAET
ncbi:LysR family transcriptional regulator [Anaeromyxobacter sp. Fw109-5]|uniref:LysR family transcriptional regulator n=1 Tax=Anaeromyxobacter sp. (strain Fw109-5) TaxID=404589 RepID=UPI0000ED8BAD|nr:LysR family transcriptional regulator [Anaeromyxobacter sp. Fw109-5]ABS27426.1 transcriptional regulator, LysR family [Anaeromyxobacter sp. Fw109-5]